MKLSDDQRDKLLKHLEKFNISTHKCPVCNKSDWEGSDRIFQLPEYKEGILGSHVQPVIPIVCKECGYSMLFNAIIMNIVDKN